MAFSRLALPVMCPTLSMLTLPPPPLASRSNMSDESQDYEFALPKGSFISLCPRVGTLAPRQSVRLKVDYTADASLLEEHPLPSTSGQVRGSARVVLTCLPAL